MDRYCIYCGKPLSETGICTCLSRFSSIVSEDVEEQTPEMEEVVPEVEAVVQEAEEAQEQSQEPVEIPEEPTRREAPKTREDSTQAWKKSYRGHYAARREPLESSYYYSRGFGDFLIGYFRDFMGTGRKLANSGDSGYGFLLMILSVVITAICTLLYSVIRLDDFLVRWIFVGFMVPVLAFGVTFVFVVLVIGGGRETVSAGKILNTVGLSSVFPTTFQLIALIPSLLDKSKRVFQFFALVIFLVWIFSLYFTVFSVHRVKVRFRTLIIVVAFAFLTLVTLRSLWMWFLTDYMQFAFYLPTSLYPGELYEAFLSK